MPMLISARAPGQNRWGRMRPDSYPLRQKKSPDNQGFFMSIITAAINKIYDLYGAYPPAESLRP